MTTWPITLSRTARMRKHAFALMHDPCRRHHEVEPGTEPGAPGRCARCLQAELVRTECARIWMDGIVPPDEARRLALNHHELDAADAAEALNIAAEGIRAISADPPADIAYWRDGSRFDPTARTEESPGDGPSRTVNSRPGSSHAYRALPGQTAFGADAGV